MWPKHLLPPNRSSVDEGQYRRALHMTDSEQSTSSACLTPAQFARNIRYTVLMWFVIFWCRRREAQAERWRVRIRKAIMYKADLSEASMDRLIASWEEDGPDMTFSMRLWKAGIRRTSQ